MSVKLSSIINNFAVYWNLTSLMQLRLFTKGIYKIVFLSISLCSQFQVIQIALCPKTIFLDILDFSWGDNSDQFVSLLNCITLLLFLFLNSTTSPASAKAQKLFSCIIPFTDQTSLGNYLHF